MTEFQDLSPYEYLPSPIPMRSLGWLGPHEGLQSGGRRSMAEDDLRRFRAASWRMANVTLGYHDCEFCAVEAAARGNGEYHYYLITGAVYAAPALILHYIVEHGYRLPEEFLEGFRATTDLPWDSRAERFCEILADESEDPDFRRQAITDIVHWRDPRAFRALLNATRDNELVDIVGDEIGRSLAAFQEYDFATELDSAELPESVRFGLGWLR